MTAREATRQLQFINQTRRKLALGGLGLIGGLVLAKNRTGAGWNIRIILVPERQMIALNRRYFERSETTDVISFNLNAATEPVLEGEVYICLEVAERQAKVYGVSLGNELQRLATHGLYHLLGYEDGEPQQKEIMTALEDEALQQAAACLGR
ncbi:MAG TPA: rRNA maturation RNase YbeY [bacterium]|nr:rRNA maturation RNase YbeY [bacterium]HQG44900.1 rRNA maturation RNase YbeY [bacterium]HQI48032.1 rRNA maturation RNase YbeY [bacterium]HQJ63588.1 rRNA maturation RNase YbeY [bacterium]